LELGDSLCGTASWTYKEMGVGVIVKERPMQGQRGVSRKLRVLGFETGEGTGCTPLMVELAFRCTQAELLAYRSHPRPSCPLFVIWTLSPPRPDPKTVKSH